MNEAILQESINNFILLLEKKDFKNVLIDELNKNIDIPFINEKTEKKILEELYKVVLNTLKNRMLKIDYV